MARIDFSAVSSQALNQARSLLASWFPAGNVSGREFLIGALDGRGGKSLSINIESGRWSDFSSGEKGGDLVSLRAAMLGISQADAARDIQSALGIVPAVEPKSPRVVITPVPADAAECRFHHSRHGDAVSAWAYKDAAGQLLGYIARYEPKGQRKQIIPFTYGRTGDQAPEWGMGQWPAPRPLYGLDDLAARPGSPVLLVEGEKAADAARRIVPHYAVLTWPGGAQARTKADWSPLKGRKVLLWPDCDKPGIEAMWEIGHRLLKICPEVKVILAEGKPEGWDAADAVAEGWDWAALKTWAGPLLKTLNEGGGVLAYEYFKSTTDGRLDVEGQGNGTRVVPFRTEPSINGNGRDGGGAVPAAGGREPITETTVGASRDSPGPAGPPEGASGRQVNWYAWKLDITGNGQPVANLNNAVAILEHDSAMSGMVWFDTFLQRILTRGDGDTVRPWTEADDINLTLDFQRRHGIVRMSREIVSQAVTAIAMRKLRHCLLEWLSPLEWDGIPRVESFFEDHFGAPGTEYTRAVSRIFWLSMVARVFEPGCKVDTTVVLEGEQGRGKSQAVEIIGGAWYMEQKEDVEGKDFFQVLKGKWVVEISEMDSFSRAEMGRVKQAISCRVDTYRGTYARDPEDHPRQCVFVITTNNYSWNRDESGARRFLPIRCVGDVDIAQVRARRSALFAEAVSLYNAAKGCQECQKHPAGRCTCHDWWTTPAEATRLEQQERYDADPWLGEIQDYVALKTEVSVTEILMEALKIERGRLTRSDQMRVAGCLRFAGWRNVGKVRDSQKTIRIWKRKDEQ